MVQVELIGIFVIALGTLYIYYKLVIFNFWRKRGVFYIEPIVPLGNVTDVIIGKKPSGVFFHDVYMKYKEHRAFGMYMIYKPNLVIADLDLIKIVLVKEFTSFHDRGIFHNEKIDPLSGHLFLLPGKKWRDLRVKLTPTFTSGKIKQMFPIVKDIGEELAKYLESKAQMRDVIEIKDIFGRYSTEIIMSVAFGIKSNCIEELENKYYMMAKKSFKLNAFWVILFTFASQIMDFFSIPLINRDVTSFYMNMFQENVQYRKAHNIVRHDFMNLLIQLMEKGYVESDDDKETSNAMNHGFNISYYKIISEI